EDTSNSEESPQNTLGSHVISAKVYFHPRTDCVSCAGLSPNGGFQMNYDLVLRSIRELNVLAGEGETFVQTTGTGAKLAKKDPIQLKLYRDGIVMFDGPFRSYQEHSTQQCMQDLMDGYFPSELQQRFPDGVPFEVRLCNIFSICKHPVPQQAAKGGSKGRERDQHQGFPEENSAGEKQRSIHQPQTQTSA
uniref:UBX domain-containing protein 11 n=1 Tax=Xiphophorus couchianus TaxID=32473 RepID=A0A3B5MK89_9TELE